MSKIITIIKNLTNFTTKNNIKPLGRWQLNYNFIDKKIELANEDHCGICDQYRFIKLNQQNKSH